MFDLQYHAIEEVDQHFQLLFNKPKDSCLMDLLLDFFSCFDLVFEYNYRNFYICWFHIHNLEVEEEADLQYHAIMELDRHFQLLFNIPMDSFLMD